MRHSIDIELLFKVIKEMAFLKDPFPPILSVPSRTKKIWSAYVGDSGDGVPLVFCFRLAVEYVVK